jgi:hypothetical protein
VWLARVGQVGLVCLLGQCMCGTCGPMWVWFAFLDNVWLAGVDQFCPVTPFGDSVCFARVCHYGTGMLFGTVYV